MCFLREYPIILNTSVGIGILNDTGKYFRSRCKFSVFSHTQFDALRDGTCGHYSQCLWENVFINKHDVSSCFLFIARTESIHHRHGFCCCRSFVQQGTIGQWHGGKVTNGCLKVHKGFKTPLWNFGLIRSVRSIPHRVFKHVSLNNGRGNGIVPSHSDVWCKQFVFACQLGYVVAELIFRHGRR